MSDYKPIVPKRLIISLGLAGVSGASFATTQLSGGLIELAAWLILAVCAGGFVSVLRKNA
jgi:hypothetical protein